MMLCVYLVSSLGAACVVVLFVQKCCGLGLVSSPMMQFSVDI